MLEVKSMNKEEFIEKGGNEYKTLNSVQKAYMLGFMNCAILFNESVNDTPEPKEDKVS